jgi:2-dehydro-3-deoxygalactonokinase
MIAVDWGTSSFRAYRLDAAGEVVDRRSAAAGLLSCQGRFEEVLLQNLSGWEDKLVVMAGMIGSRNGWHEVPYVPCPAGLAEIAEGMIEISSPAFTSRRIFIAPGLSSRSEGGLPEVMRGEETQMLGLLDALPEDGPHTLCLPGTHSKWATASAGRINAFQTAMTGELYALLIQHSLLGALMELDGGDKVSADAAFELGVATSRQPGGLPSHLFSVRTRCLSLELTPTQLPPYLSGLLIGHELAGLLGAAQHVHLIGGTALVQTYKRALAMQDMKTTTHGEVLAAKGLYRLARSRHLLALDAA